MIGVNGGYRLPVDPERQGHGRGDARSGEPFADTLVGRTEAGPRHLRIADLANHRHRLRIHIGEDGRNRHLRIHAGRHFHFAPAGGHDRIPLKIGEAKTVESGEGAKLAHRLVGKLQRVVTAQAVAHRSDHSDPVGQALLGGQLRLDQILVALAAGADVQRDIAPFNAEIVNHALVLRQPGHAVAQRMDRLAAD
jgi:hypothetical protein